MAENGDPAIPATHKPVPFVPNRFIPLCMVIVCGGLLAWNHYNMLQSGQAYIWIIVLAPLFFSLGIGGLIDPRIAWAIGPRAGQFPLRIKVIGGFLALMGLALSAYLALGVYHIQEVGEHKSPGIIQSLSVTGMQF